MEMEPDQRRQLGAFLRARREALPAPGFGRRRTPGLRREEVAGQAGVSTTWYAWAEQGRAISLSPEALARLAGALRLTPAERAYMFTLAGKLDPAPPAPAQGVPEALRALTLSIASPAYLLDPLYTGHGWNGPARALFAPWLASGEANLLRYVFLHAGARQFIADWPSRARRLAAEFRADAAHEPARLALAGELAAASAEFAQLWNSHAVLGHEGGIRSFAAEARYQQHNLMPAAHPGWRLVILVKIQ